MHVHCKSRYLYMYVTSNQQMMAEPEEKSTANRMRPIAKSASNGRYGLSKGFWPLRLRPLDT